MKYTLIAMAAAAVEGVKLTREPLLTCAPTPPATHNMNYFVPHFGEDREIMASKSSAAAAEKSLGHVWNPPDAPSIDRDYFVPHFGEDQDIIDAKNNIADQEALHGKWTPTQDDNGFWNLPGPADNKSYNYRGHFENNWQLYSVAVEPPKTA